VTGGTFGPRTDTCKYGHSMDDCFIYKRIVLGVVYTVRTCRYCKRRRDQKYRNNNRDAQRIVDRAYWRRNREKRLESQRRYRANKRKKLEALEAMKPPEVKETVKKVKKIVPKKVVIIQSSALDCGHQSQFKPIPEVGDVVWCLKCTNYRVVI
jgi:hypothetical protein